VVWRTVWSGVVRLRQVGSCRVAFSNVPWSSVARCKVMISFSRLGCVG